MLRSRWPLVVVTGTLLWASGAQAVGLGAAPPSVLMGAPLEFAVPVQLEPGESLDGECLSAEVQIGDRRQPAFSVSAVIDTTSDARRPWVRVGTLAVVDEPVVAVQVSLGCSARIVRQYTVLADPPFPGPGIPPAPAVASVQGTTSSPSVGSSEPALPTPAAQASVPVRVGQQAADRARKPAPAARAPKPRKPRAAAPAPTGRATAIAPRLSLDAPDPEILQRAIAAALAEQQASAASALAQAANAASAAAARVQGLEDQLVALRAEGAAQREQLQALRQRLAQADAARAWMPWVLAAFAALAGLSIWLGWRLHRLRHEQHPQWWADAKQILADARRDEHAPTPPDIAQPRPKPDEPVGSKPRPYRDGPASAARARASEDDWVQEATSPRPVVPPLVFDAPAPVTLVEPQAPASSRAVSVDELIDLEQQAEFFVVLGQDDAAIDLLMGHLRDTGGTSPLPYLKLLEIYRRQGDREAYERTRTRFNQRFNAYAPDWDTDMRHGRSLDEYEQVMTRLERAWPSPLDAMAELEALLFRKDGGEVFDLPAYREVLMLYALAHALMGEAGTEAPSVDVLLPLDSRFQMDVTAPLPGAALGESTIVVTPDIMLDRPTQFASVDLELADLEPDTRPPPQGGAN
ncbi:MAG: hypothetical protein HUU30_04730 [Burkholderiaceae bacterium]|nr:hypothetical protein [Aquabacterium sp.]NUP85044.1 hypothetical protein [Burkholderiaceae bacterium]